MTAPTLDAALDAVPPHVRAVAVRLVEAAGGREPAIYQPDDEEAGWLLVWFTPVMYVSVEFDPDGKAYWFARHNPTGKYDGDDLPADSIPDRLAGALRSLA